MQTIDPIKPFQPLQRARRHNMSTISLPPPPPPPRPPRPRTGRSIDGLVSLPPLRPFVRQLHPPARSLPPRRPVAPVAPKSSVDEPLARRKTAHTAPSKLEMPSRLHLTKKRLEIGVVCAALLVGLSLATHQPFGQLAVILYGLVAIIGKIPSRITFILALVSLVFIPVTLAVFGGTNIVSSGLATYAFLLLIIGTISLGLELRYETKVDKSQVAG